MAATTSNARALIGFKGNGCCSSSSSSRSSFLRMTSLPMPSSCKGRRIGAVMTATAATCQSVFMPAAACDLWKGAVAAAAFDYEKKKKEEEEQRRMNDSVTAEKLDELIRNSIGEIVRNTGGEAPFLMQIFAKGPSLLKIEKEEAMPESWPSIKQTWKQGLNSVPDGVILVKQLNEEDEEEEEDAEAAANHNNNSNSESCRRWGLVVQGRGMDCAAASCYILNTCRVRSPAGFCTHFCLVRANCFGDSFDKQLSKAWLQGR